jgi:hypothetical protein
MDLQEIQKWLKENAERDDVKTYLSEISKPSQEKEIEIIETFKKSQSFKSEFDSAVSKAVENHDTKIKPKLEKELRDKINLELNPPKDPALIEALKGIEELKQANAEKDAKLAQTNRINYLHSAIQPDYKDFIKLFDGSIETDEDRVKFLNESIFKIQASGTPKPVHSNTSVQGQLTESDAAKMKPEEIVKALSEGRFNAELGRAN